MNIIILMQARLVVMHAIYILCPTPKVNTALDLPVWLMSVMIVLVKLVGCILLISVCCCNVAWSQSQSESCTNRSIEYADCISKAGLSVSLIFKKQLARSTTA